MTLISNRKWISRGFFASSMMLMLLSIPGCGGRSIDKMQTFPVKGKVLRNGKPLADALVVFHPKSGVDTRATTSSAQTNADGVFQMTTYEQNDGVAKGQWTITVEFYELLKQGESYSPGPNVLPKRLSSPATSDIVVEIKEGENVLEPFEVGK